MASSTSTSWASATRDPRPEEWWFGTWDIQEKVWPLSKGKGVTVALIDSGVNAGLPDLRGRILPGRNIIGPSGDGRKDLDKGGGHGTAMAATIVGQGLGAGMVGIAPEANILPIYSTVEDLAPAIDYATDHGAKVINVSQGLASPPSAGGCDRGIQRAITRAIQHDVVLVASAGNDASMGVMNQEPAQCPGFLTVGAVDYKFNPWVDSQPAPYVAVAAPGVHTGSIGKTGTFFPNLSGTSNSAALASGVVALVRAKYPKMPAREVVQRIIGTARDVASPGRDDQTGYGLIRPYHALTDKVSASSPNPVYSAWDATQRLSVPTTLSPSSSTSQHASQNRHKSMVSIYLFSIGGICLGVVAIVSAFLLINRARSRAHASRVHKYSFSRNGGSDG
ncbi:S8 family serine peptidase [Actinoallomurus sp. CA-150999]|uniref:S8 family serine peptidase n=1 Tax=Actinoallomurus sp. CA-150999 TaxID=3239887 RepID=UPI003D91DDBA